MSTSKHPILVFGASGQQGGSVANALLAAGWPVRALVRDPQSVRAIALRDAGAELVQATYDDVDIIRRAMQGSYGVFSVQPSSPGGTVSDEDEVRFGITIADLAAENNLRHLVYSSGAAVSDRPTGLGHFDSKARIEAHIRTLPITATIVRPAAFMEMLLMPGFGLDEGRFNFFLRPDQSMQMIAVEDIGHYVAAVFADVDKFGGQTFEIASDQVTGQDLEVVFSRMAGQLIPYRRFSDEVLNANPFLQKLTALTDQGRLAGNADFALLRQMHPAMLSFNHWLTTRGREAFLRATVTAGNWAYNTPA